MKSVQIRCYFWSVFSCTRTEYEISLFSPNTGKFGPEITQYLGNFHAVIKYMKILKFVEDWDEYQAKIRLFR